MDAMTRTCTICGQTKPLEAFRPGKLYRFGRMPRCRDCLNARKRERHAANPQKGREQDKAYRRKHPEVRERERVYEEANRERINRLNRERHAADPERYRAKDRAPRQRDPEHYAATHRRWRAEHADSVRATVRRFYLAHKTQNLAANRAWCRAHPERMREKNRKYRMAYPAAVVAMSQRRRARKAGADGSFTAREWRALCDFYGGACLRCGAGDRVLAADHVTPLSRGGSNDIANIQVLCRDCNSIKGIKDTDYRTRSVADFMVFLTTYPYLRRPKRTAIRAVSPR